MTTKASPGTQPPAGGKISEERLRQLRTAVLCMPLDDTEARDLLAIIDAYRHPAPVADERADINDLLNDHQHAVRAYDSDRNKYTLEALNEARTAIVGCVAPPPSSSPSATADATLRAALEQIAPWLRNGDYESRGGLIEMSRLAGVAEDALAGNPPAKDDGLRAALERDAARYRFFRSRWEAPISWQHGTIEDYDVIDQSEHVAADATWGDERIGTALDRSVDAALAGNEGEK